MTLNSYDMSKVLMLYLQRSDGLKIMLHLGIPNKAAHVDAPQADIGVPRKLLGGPTILYLID